MFWDGTDWIDEQPRRSDRRPPRRLTDILATIPILLLVPLLLTPYLTVTAADAQLAVSGVPYPGSTLQVAGSNWPASTPIQLTWDGSSAGMPSTRVSNRGAFTVSVVVPASATPAPHELAAVAAKTGKVTKSSSPKTATASVMASLTITVVSPESPGETIGPVPSTGPTATAALAPTFGPTLPPAPTLGPTLPPAPTLGPTPAPTLTATFGPIVTQQPTPAPTPTRTPTPTVFGPTPSPTAGPTPTATPSRTPSPTPTPPPSGPTLTFAAECNGGSVDSRFRALYQPGDPGFGLDSDFMGDLRQVSAGNGYCRITAEERSTPSGRAYASACLATYNTFAQRYGVFEARIRYPKGAGVWPAFWLLAEGSKQTPPEIDIFEAYPGPGTGSSGSSVAVFSNHYSGGTQYVAFDGGGDLTGSWHVWRFEWTPDAIVLRLDGAKVGTLTGHVPTTRMYPIINLALGAPGYRVDASTPNVMYMDVDYLRVYAP